jgi:Glutathione S-transferase
VKKLDYQYCEIYPLRKPKPTPLLEANPRGLVPAIREGDWACSESSVILEYVSITLGFSQLVGEPSTDKKHTIQTTA